MIQFNVNINDIYEAKDPDFYQGAKIFKIESVSAYMKNNDIAHQVVFICIEDIEKNPNAVHYDAKDINKQNPKRKRVVLEEKEILEFFTKA